MMTLQQATDEARVTTEGLADIMLYLFEYHEEELLLMMSETNYNYSKDWVARLKKARKKLREG